MKDQYLKKNSNLKRLIREYEKYNSLVIAFDFDNTVYDFHKEGETYSKVIKLLKQLKEINCYLICFTANEDEEFVKNYLNEMKIPFDKINENPKFFQNSNSRKIYYNVLLDDRAGLKQTYKELKNIYKKFKNK